MFPPQQLLAVIIIGVLATAFLDLWLLVLKRLGIPVGSFALVGRWVAHMVQGKFSHVAIAAAKPMSSELVIGWFVHYVVGIAFAGALVALEGFAWVRQPTFMPAFLTGIATVVMPLFVMQPAMGLGFAATKTATPLKNCARSIANHAMFGVGMYLAAMAVSKSTQ